MGRETLRPGVEVETIEYGQSVHSDALVVWGHGLGNSMGGEDDERLWDFWRCAGDDDVIDEGSQTFQNSTHVVRYHAVGHGASSAASSPSQCAWDTLGGDMLALARLKRRSEEAHQSDKCKKNQKLIVGGASMGDASAIFALRKAMQEAEEARQGVESTSCGNTDDPEIDGLILVIVPTFHDTRATRKTQIESAVARGFDATSKRRKRRPIFKNTHRGDEPATPLGVRQDSFECVMTASAQSDLPSLEEMRRMLDEKSSKVPKTLVLCWDCGDATHPASSAHLLREIAPHAKVEIATTLQEVNTWNGRIRGFVGEVVGG